MLTGELHLLLAIGVGVESIVPGQLRLTIAAPTQLLPVQMALPFCTSALFGSIECATPAILPQSVAPQQRERRPLAAGHAMPACRALQATAGAHP